MSNIVEFVLKLKDMMSGGMQRAASTAQSAMGRVNAVTARAENGFRRLRSPISGINQQLDDLRRTRDLSVNLGQIRAANREIERLEARRDRLENLGTRRGGSSSGSGGGLLGMMGGVRGLVAGAGIAAATAGIGSTLSQAMDAGAQKISLEVMAGKEAGGKLFGELTRFANDSIFGTEVFQNAQTMKAFGMETQKVMPTMRMLGDISMGNKDKMQSLTLAYSQIQATGRLMGQDLLQLVNAGFNPLQIISQKTGIGMDVLKEKMEKGAISAKMVEEAFKSATGPGGQFFNMTNKIAETPFGKWEALKGQVSGLAVQFGTALMPMATQVMGFLGTMADKVPALIGAVQPVMEMVSSLVGDYFSQAMAIFPQIIAGVKPVVESVMPLMKTVFGIVGDFVKQQGPRFLRIFQAIAPILTSVGNILSFVLSPALRLASWLFNKMLDMVTWLIEKLSWLISPILKVGEVLTGVFGTFFDGVADTIEGKTTQVSSSLGRMMNSPKVKVVFTDAGTAHGAEYVQRILRQVDTQVGKISQRINQAELAEQWKQAGKEHGNAYATGMSAAIQQAKWLQTDPSSWMKHTSDWMPNTGRAVDNTGRTIAVGSGFQRMQNMLDLLPELPKILDKYAQVGPKAFDIAARTAMDAAKKYNLTDKVGKIINDVYLKYKDGKIGGAASTETTKPGGKGISDTNSFGDLKSGKEINGGGLRAVNIVIHKFFDQNIVNVKSAEEGRTATGEKVAEELLRICHSVGENLAAA